MAAKGAMPPKDSMYPAKGGKPHDFSRGGAKAPADSAHKPGSGSKGGGFANTGARNGTAHKTPLASSKGAMAKNPGSAVGVRARKCGD